MTVRPKARRIALAAAGALAALGLTACGSANTAAVVNGDVISEQDAQTAAQQITEAFDLQTPLTTTDAVSSLVLAPFVIDAAADSGHPVSAEAARAALSAIDDPNEAAVTLVRANSAYQVLTNADHAAILEEISKADVQVNPRYGTFDPSQGVVPNQPNWIKAPGRAPAATPQG